ncbi:MAG: DUF86 domain-containing protein [Clostridia bacterium]|nr:DUF86 domain-containing protein [Clostridia bacterium]
MGTDDRDRSVIEKMLTYCRQIEEAHVQFGRDRQVFVENSVYQNAVALCVMQIGELANHLSEEFRREHAGIPWRAIRGMRNLVAHEYGRLDAAILWETATEDIVELGQYCKTVLGQ